MEVIIGLKLYVDVAFLYYVQVVDSLDPMEQNFLFDTNDNSLGGFANMFEDETDNSQAIHSLLNSRPEHLKTSNASLSIPGFQRSHHASSGPAGQYGGLLDEHQRRSKVSEATAIRSSDSLEMIETGFGLPFGILLVIFDPCLLWYLKMKKIRQKEETQNMDSDISLSQWLPRASKVEVVIILQEIDQLSMILSTISNASRLHTSGKILSDMGIVKTKHGYFLLFLAQS
ncbi:hypothetical protein Tco_1457715 [Tanacetum coccineum]